jgi:hypothetical protein
LRPGYTAGYTKADGHEQPVSRLFMLLITVHIAIQNNTSHSSYYLANNCPREEVLFFGTIQNYRLSIIAFPVPEMLVPIIFMPCNRFLLFM